VTGGPKEDNSHTFTERWTDEVILTSTGDERDDSMGLMGYNGLLTWYLFTSLRDDYHQMLEGFVRESSLSRKKQSWWKEGNVIDGQHNLLVDFAFSFFSTLFPALTANDRICYSLGFMVRCQSGFVVDTFACLIFICFSFFNSSM